MGGGLAAAPLLLGRREATPRAFAAGVKSAGPAAVSGVTGRQGKNPPRAGAEGPGARAERGGPPGSSVPRLPEAAGPPAAREPRPGWSPAQCLPAAAERSWDVPVSGTGSGRGGGSGPWFGCGAKAGWGRVLVLGRLTVMRCTPATPRCSP